jgi:hypothetical protein
MGEAKRKREAAEEYRGPGQCTCPLVSVTEVPAIDPECPIHGTIVPRPTPEIDDALGVPSSVKRPPTAAGKTIALTREAALPNHWNDKEPEPNSFRCPHCGAWRPPYGINDPQGPQIALVAAPRIEAGRQAAAGEPAI